MCHTGIDFFARKTPKNHLYVLIEIKQWSEKVIKRNFDRI